MRSVRGTTMTYVYTKPKKLFKYLEKAKVDAMLDRARADNTRNYLILQTLWKTGVRNSELCNLKKRDIKKDEITVRGGKGGKDRVIPIDTSLWDLLTLFTADLNLDNYLFPLSDMAIRNITHKYQGDEDVHPHTFRHSFAVFFLKSGGNIRALQKIMGHSDLNTTADYLDLIAEDIKDEYKKVQW